MMMTNRFIKIGAAAELCSKTCSRCGTVKESLLLSERVFNCEHCNFSCELDLNAGLNLAMAVSSTVTACGLDNADVARMKQE